MSLEEEIYNNGSPDHIDDKFDIPGRNLNPYGLESPLNEEEILKFIAELPVKFDYIKDYEKLKTFIEKQGYRKLKNLLLPIDFILFLKQEILKIPAASSNPFANIVINQAVTACYINVHYISASELLLQLTKAIVRLKKKQSKGFQT